MLQIETDPSIWGREIAAKSIKSLDLLQSGLSIDELKEKPDLNEMLSSAVSNLSFVNEQISPVVEDFYDLTKKRLEFGYGFKLSALNPVGIRLITYNYPAAPNKLGFAFAPERKPAELTESILVRLYNGINPDAVEGLGKLSRGEVIKKFKNHIASFIK